MELVQLIEKVKMKDALWMTFWDLDEKARLSMEIRNPARRYKIGDVFQLDKNAHHELEALQTDFDHAQLYQLDLPIAVRNAAKFKRRWTNTVRKFAYAEPKAPGLGGLVYVSDEQHTLAG